MEIIKNILESELTFMICDREFRLKNQFIKYLINQRESYLIKSKEMINYNLSSSSGFVFNDCITSEEILNIVCNVKNKNIFLLEPFSSIVFEKKNNLNFINQFIRSLSYYLRDSVNKLFMYNHSYNLPSTILYSSTIYFNIDVEKIDIIKNRYGDNGQFNLHYS